MIVLGIDTSMKISSAAVAEYKNGAFTVLASSQSDGIIPHSENLLPMIDSALKSCGLEIGGVGVFAAANGPGSFTGIRIGVATIKGLAFGRGLCCAGVSALDALREAAVIESAPEKYIAAPLIDARRNQAYNALYLYDGGIQKRLAPDRLILISELMDELNTPEFAPLPVYFCGDVKEETVCENRERYKFAPSGNIAEAACRLAVKSALIDPNGLVPRYLIKTQAEREYAGRIT